jgi:protein SCO1
MIPTDSRMTSRRVHRIALWLACVLGVLLLAGCNREDAIPWQLTGVTGHMPDLDFRLVDDHGKPVTGQNYRGKVVLLYFGYTHCPDVCPLTLAQLHVVMQRLGPLADGARILFVSVDPARDTPEVMHAYVNAFDPRAVGLSGAPRDIEALSKRYRSAFTREPDGPNGQYEVSHSSAIYIFDRDGKARLLSTPDRTQDELVHDLHLMLSLGTRT